MRSTEELRREIFRRAEHKRMATRRLYRRMGTLCLLLCLCGAATLWGMLGPLHREEGKKEPVSFVSREESHTVEHPGGNVQDDLTPPSEQQSEEQESSPVTGEMSENFDASQPSAEEPDEELSQESPADLPEEEGDAPEATPLPTVVLLAVPSATQGDITNPLCTVQGVLTQETPKFDAGDTLQVDLSTDLKLYGGESILAVGEWQNGVFVVEEGDWMLFCDETQDEDSSVLEPDWEDPEFDPPTDEIEPPASDDVSRLDALLMMAGKYKPEQFSSTEDGKDLFEALKALYQP